MSVRTMFQRHAAIMVVLATMLVSCGKTSSPTAPSNAVTVSSTTPTAGASGVSISTSFSATMSATLDPATVTSNTFTLAVGGTNVPGHITTSGNTATFTPLAPLPTGSTFIATLTTGIKDQNGHTLASNYSWSATTQAGHPLGGILYASTTATLANSPYMLTADLQIAYGATLTIEPGVVIDGANHKVGVYGNLSAVGTSGSPVTFVNCQITPGTNIQTQPYTMTIEFATLSGGSLYAPAAAYGSLILRDSRLLNLSRYLYIWYPVADCYIERNVFAASGGISVGVAGPKVYVRNNVFVGNVFSETTAYAVECWSASSASDVIVSQNSFLSIDRVALSLPVGYSGHMLATNNYWNTSSTSAIDAMIFDKNDDLGSSGTITYQPFLTSPDPTTPDPAPWMP
jgi:Big-like domain-containing protein